MKTIIGLLMALGLSNIGFSDSLPPPQPFPAPMVLDDVSFQVSAKQWVSTQTALLMVNVNVTLNDADLVKAREQIMGKLNQVAAGEWHLTQFDRSQDSSGLEKLYVQAQARVNQASLTNIYKNAKAVTKPGASYEVGSVEFKPSLDEIQGVKLSLRKHLYELARDEIDRLNKIYVGQNYSVNELVFIDGDAAPQPRLYRENGPAKTMAMAAGEPSLSVSNELVMTAMVKAASTRKPLN